MIVTLAEAETYCRSEQPVNSTQVHGALLTAHEVFYDMCQRSFEEYDAADGATVRTYVPNGSNILRIADCTTVTLVQVDGATIAASAYQTEPYGPTLTGETRPIEQIRYLNWAWYPSTVGKATVYVTGTWGWAAPPAAAIEAVKSLTKDIATNRDLRAGYASFGDVGIAAARSNRFVNDVATRYGRAEALFGIA